MSYQSTAATRAQQVHNDYLDRYGKGEPSPSYEEVQTEDGDYFEYPAGEEGDSTNKYRRLASGEAPSGDESPDYLNELDELEGEIDGLEGNENDSDGWNPTQAMEQLNVLRAEVEASHLPAALKEEFTKKIQGLIEKLQAGRLEDTFEIEDLKSEYELALEENPSRIRRLSQRLAEAGIDVTEAKIQTALETAKLSEEELAKIQLPPDAATSRRLLEFFQELDPAFAQNFQEDPYGENSRKKLTQLLTFALNQQESVTEDKAVELLDQVVTLSWNESGMRESVSGNWLESHRSFMERMSEVVGGDDATIEAMHGYMWSGFNDWERGHHNRNDEVRRFISAIFQFADRNPYLLRRYLKMIPESILVDLRDTVNYHTGELNEMHSGDLFTSQGAHDIVDWVLAGGEMPMELRDETPSQSPSSPEPESAPTQSA